MAGVRRSFGIAFQTAQNQGGMCCRVAKAIAESAVIERACHDHAAYAKRRNCHCSIFGWLRRVSYVTTEDGYHCSEHILERRLDLLITARNIAG